MVVSPKCVVMIQTSDHGPLTDGLLPALPIALHEMPTLFSECSYIVLQANHDVFGKPGYTPILLSI